MNFNIGDRVQFNDLQGTVTRLNILNVQNSCQVTLDNGSIRAFFGTDIELLSLVQ